MDICGEEAVYMPELTECDECEAFRQELEILSRLVNQMQTVLENKQDQLTAGLGITISTQNVISAERNASNTYTKEEVDALIGDVEHARYEVVDTLPATGLTNVIYLVPKTGGGHDMYIWDDVNEEFVPIGDDNLDLTGYSTTGETVSNITRSGKTFTATRADGTTFTFDQQDTTYGAATTSTAGLMSAADKTKLDAIGSVLAGTALTTTVANGTTTTAVSKLTIPTSGMWIVQGRLGFNSNTTGYRGIGLSTSQTGGTQVRVPAVTTNSATKLNTVSFSTGGTDIYLVAEQTSGANLTVSGVLLEAMRIK